jgi:hypothetical protein
MIRNSDGEHDRCKGEMVDQDKEKGATNFPTTSPLLRWTLVPIGDSREDAAGSLPCRKDKSDSLLCPDRASRVTPRAHNTSITTVPKAYTSDALLIPDSPCKISGAAHRMERDLRRGSADSSPGVTAESPKSARRACLASTHTW